MTTQSNEEKWIDDLDKAGLNKGHGFYTITEIEDIYLAARKKAQEEIDESNEEYLTIFLNECGFDNSGCYDITEVKRHFKYWIEIQKETAVEKEIQSLTQQLEELRKELVIKCDGEMMITSDICKHGIGSSSLCKICSLEFQNGFLISNNNKLTQQLKEREEVSINLRNALYNLHEQSSEMFTETQHLEQLIAQVVPLLQESFDELDHIYCKGLISRIEQWLEKVRRVL